MTNDLSYDSDDNDNVKSILLVSYPKIVFLYPAFLMAIFASFWTYFKPADSSSEVVTLLFLLMLAFNFFVLAFDFPRTTSLTLVFFLLAVSVSLWMFFAYNPTMLPFVSNVISKLRPLANSTFYILFSVLMFLLYLGVWVSRSFDYWEVRPNELLHHHGFMSDLERFSAPRLRIDKEINDVFEYLLLGSGRLILHPSNERRAIVLENVFFINRKEKEITRMLGALQVQVREN